MGAVSGPLNKRAKIEVRVTESEKARWQGEADELQTTLSELVRASLNGSKRVAHADALELPELARIRIDLDSAELESLRGWLQLEDSDGNIDPEQLAEWKSVAAKGGITFAELLTRVALYVNLALI